MNFDRAISSAGTVADPDFEVSAGTGIYNAGANKLGITTNGVLRRTISAVDEIATLPQTGPAGSASAPTYSFSSDADTGMYHAVGADTLAFATAGSAKLTMDTVSINPGLPINAGDGAVGAPSYSFTSSPASGIYSSGSGNVDITVNGTQALNIEDDRSNFAGVVQAADGVVGEPSFSFNNDTDTGMYSVAANSLGFSTGGTNRVTVSSSTLESTLPITAVSVGSRYATTVSSASTLTLTSASAGVQEITGGANQNVNLPDATTLQLGHTFQIIATFTSPKTLTIRDNGSNSLLAVTGSAHSVYFVLTANGTSNGTWVYYELATNAGIAQTTVKMSAAGNITAVNNVYAADGTVGAPAFSFSSDPDTGIYQTGVANTMGFSTGGAQRMSVSTTAITSTLPIIYPLGTVGAPSITFTGGTTTGIYAPTIATVAVAIGGSQALTVQAGAMISAGVVVAPTAAASAPGLTFSGTTNRGVYSSATGNVGLAVGGNSILEATATALTQTVPSIAPMGSGGAPSYSFTGAATTGMYGDVGSVDFSVAASKRLSVGANYTTHENLVRLPFGTATDPSICFNTDENCGIYHGDTDTLSIATNGTKRVDVSTTAVTSTLPMLGAAGSASAPTYSFSANPDIGMFQTGGQLRLATGGTEQVTISTTGFTSALPITSVTGSATAPSYRFTSDGDTGMYSGNADTIRFTTAGTLRHTISTAAETTTLPQVGANGSASAPTYSFSGDPNTGMYWDSADIIGFSAGGTQRLSVSGTDIIGSVRFVAPAGSASSASYVFAGDGSTGLYSTGAGNINMTTSGTLRKTLGTTIETNTLLQRGPDGSAGAPSYAFSSDPNTGIYWISADDVGVSTGGTLRLDVSTTAVTSTLPVGVPSYTVASIPAATTAGQIIYVSNETGGAVLAFSDGTNFRRVTDRAIVA